MMLRVMVVACAVLMGAVASAAQAAVQAGPFVNPATGHRYYLLTPNTWTASEAEAVSLGGHLAAISNQAENDFVFDTFAPLVPNGSDALWIGLNDAGQEGTFTWTTGELLNYTHWGSGEPNNDPGWGGEDHVQMIVHPFNF